MEDNLLTTEQVLLLENLTYLLDNGGLRSLETIVENYAADGKEDVSVGDIVAKIAENLVDDADYGSHITGKDWENILQAIEKDPVLKEMKVVAVYGDPAKAENETSTPSEPKADKEGAISAVFVNEKSGEAVVAFRGTVGYEWKDNFLGGTKTAAADGVSTEYQEKALAWYRSLNLEEAGYETITVTGHSKGGNKAKYITIMDESVDRCISFDGQGFSDEFVAEYEEEIGKRAYKITNHNVEYDFVNLLLNDIGKTKYYRGYDYGEGKLAEAHCPNTFFTYDEEGKPHMHPVADRAEEMKVLDEFLNGYLRTLSPEEKAKKISFIAEIADMVMYEDAETKTAEELINKYGVLFVAEFVLSLLGYLRMHPEMIEAVTSVLVEFEVLDKTVMIVEEILFIIGPQMCKPIKEVQKYFDEFASNVSEIYEYDESHYIKWVKQQLSEEFSFEQIEDSRTTRRIKNVFMDVWDSTIPPKSLQNIAEELMMQNPDKNISELMKIFAKTYPSKKRQSRHVFNILSKLLER